MSESLEECYERALTFLEETAPAFARLYPAQAGAILNKGEHLADPHLERMIEGFALLAGRVDHKIDSEFPVLIESLLQVLYPHLGLIVPPMAIVQLGADLPPKAVKFGMFVPPATVLRSRPVGRHRVACQYRTGYATTLWPLEVEAAEWRSPPGSDLTPPPRTVAALRLRLSCPSGMSLLDLPLGKLRFYLQGDRPLVVRLYEAIFLQCLRVEYILHGKEGPIGSHMLEPGEALRQVGFDMSEGLLPFPPQAFPGFRHLIEVLSFPAKYLFIDLLGLDRLREIGGGAKAVDFEIVLYFPQTHELLERNLGKQTFLLGCTPVVNLFPKSAEPVDLNHRRSKYWLVPSRTQQEGHEVYSVEEIDLLDNDQDRQGPLAPLYASTGKAVLARGSWLATRRPATREDDAGKPVVVAGSEVDLHIVDRELEVHRPTSAVLNVHTLCTNRDVPGTAQQGGDTLTGPRDPSGVALKATLLHAPTKALRPPLRQAAYWRLLSQNALNHLTLVQRPHGLEALQELLRLHDFTGAENNQLAAVIRQNIDGLSSVQARPVQACVTSDKKIGYCRGLEIEIELDERHYGSTGVFLFAGVLERFFSLYAPVNSFVQTVVKTTQSKDILKRWPPRAAEQQLR